jgi:hypothetical protein
MEKEEKVWSGTDEDECVELCKMFREEGVGFRVDQHAYTVEKRNVDRYFAILVPTEFYEDAKAIVDEYEEASRDEVAEGDESNTIAEAPEAAQDVVSEEERGRRSSARPDDDEMTVEVWAGRSGDGDTMVEACLYEMEIRCRVVRADDGSARILVSPSDENIAREIVREVQEGTPPE